MWYDLAMVAILLYTTVRGSTKGIAWQLAAIGALVLCFAFATPLSLVVAPAIRLDPPLNRWVAMLGIYLVFSFLCFGAARVFRSWLESWKFEEYDKHLGAIFGFLKGATICLVITFFTVCLSAPARHYVLATYSGRTSRAVMQNLTAVMPAEIDRVLEPYVEKLGVDIDQVADGDVTEDEDEMIAGRGHRHGDGFRGSSRPGGDIFSDGDEPFLRSRGADGDDEPADEDREPSEESLLEKAAEKLGEKLKHGLESIVEGALSDDERESKSEESRRTHPSRHVSGEPLDQLVEAVSRVYGRSQRERDAHRAEIEALLNGIPESIARGALLDWRADLTGRGADPDPETDAATSFDARLARQIEAAGMSLEELPRPVRERLRRAASEE